MVVSRRAVITDMSVNSWCSIEMSVRIKLVFGMEAFFDLSHTVRRKFRYWQKLGCFAVERCLETLDNFTVAHQLLQHIVSLV